MNAVNKRYLLLLVVLSVFLTGCLDVTSDFRALRNDVRDAVNCRLKKDTEIRVGSGLIGLAQTFISFSDDTDAEEANEILDEISSVQVGIYKNKSRDFNPDRNALQAIEKRLADRDWNPIVKRNERDEYCLIMVQEDDGRYEKMLVIEFNENELVICEVKGNLEKIVEKAIEDEDINIVIKD